MTTTTLRTTLERLIRSHGYDPDNKTCQCVTDRAHKVELIGPISDEEHAAHVVNRIFGILNGGTTE